LRLFSFGGYGLALAALAHVVFGAYDSHPNVHQTDCSAFLKKNFITEEVFFSDED